jgi:addiction module HigA family antidote
MANEDRATVVQAAAVPHPGEVVVDYLEFRGWAQRDLARRTGLTPKTVSEICNGKAPITAPTALALEKARQRPAHFWLNLQGQSFSSREIRSMVRIGTQIPTQGDAEAPISENGRIRGGHSAKFPWCFFS